jgi:predicted glycogen debranching enzyme
MTDVNTIRPGACPHAQTPFLSGDLDEVLSREWLITNQFGSYASSTVIGCNTRRYHGLLVSAQIPPVGRIVTVNNVLERLVVDGYEHAVSNFEFNQAIHPEGYRCQTSFQQQIEQDLQSVAFVYDFDGVTFIRTLWMFGDANVVLMHWLAVDSRGNRPIRLHLHPLLSMRDFHSLRRQSAANLFDVRQSGQTLAIRVPKSMQSRANDVYELFLAPTGLRGPADAHFHSQPDWWFNFRYRIEAERGQECGEDLFVPGNYDMVGRGRVSVGLWLSTEPMPAHLADELLTRVNAHLQSGQTQFTLVDEMSSQLAPTPMSNTHNPLSEAPEVTLRKAAAQFVVRRNDLSGKPGWTILAGFPWFGDWGRDTFLSLPGLLLSTGRYEQARDVLRVFGSAQSDGLIPNRFDDYGGEPDYNSVDAALWYVYAAEEYLKTTHDRESWESLFLPVCRNVVDTFMHGTHFGIHCDEHDGLLCAGSAETQLTWMDARCGNISFTPRWGKPVELNALWYNALRTLARQLAESEPKRAGHYAELAERAGDSFRKKYWHADGRYLYDCLRDDFCDPAIRPNQIFAVSLRDTPLRPDQQMAVVECVRRHLLTPYGLRSLAPCDPSYRGCYVGDQFMRDSAYHQGTVWGFLMGPYIEAYLRVNNYSRGAADVADDLLKGLVGHLYEAGIGTISEIFDGDAPHAPKGCFAQAWSVAQTIRAMVLINQCRQVAM